MLNATLIKRTDLTDNLMLINVQPDDGVPEFIPGQYVALGLMPEAPRQAGLPAEAVQPKEGRMIKRTYSIGSSPEQREDLEFYIAIVPEGALSARLASLKEGDRVYCAPKITGKFTLEPIPQESNIVMVATGTGIAPFISMMRTSTMWERPANITLVYGVRYEQDLAYLAELEKLKKKHSAFNYHHTVSRASDSWSGNKGYVQDLFKKDQVSLDSAKDHLMLCGNPAMIDDVVELLSARGFNEHTRKESGNIHLERYW